MPDEDLQGERLAQLTVDAAFHLYRDLGPGLLESVYEMLLASRLEEVEEGWLRIHKTLRVTPAMAAGATDRLWEIADIAKLVEEAEATPKARGPYKRRPG